MDKFRLSDALSNLYEEASWLQLKAQTTQKHLKKVMFKWIILHQQMNSKFNCSEYRHFSYTGLGMRFV